MSSTPLPPLTRPVVASRAIGGPESSGAVPHWIVALVLVILFVIWSNSFHAISYFRRSVGLSSVDLLTLRYGPVALFCALWCAPRLRALRETMARDGWRVVLMGLAMVPAYNLALNWGQARVPPATASLIIATNPIFTFLLAMAFLGERGTPARVAGMALSFAGVYLLVETQRHGAPAGYTLSALVVLLAPVSWAVASVAGKQASGRNDPLLLTFASTGIGSIPFLFTFVFDPGLHERIADFTSVGWIAWAHLTLLCTIVGFAAFFWALRHWSASAVSTFVFLNPPLTSLFGIIWGTETFHWSTAVFGGVTLLGVALGTGLLHGRRPTRA